MKRVSGQDNAVLPTLRSQLDQVLLGGEKNRRDRFHATLHACLSVGFLVLGIGVAVAIRADVARKPVAALLVLPFLINVVLQFLRFRVIARRMRRLRRVVNHGVPVTVHLVQANPGLFRPGHETLPCLVLFSLQPEVASDWRYMSDLARRVYSLKGSESPDPAERIVAGMTRDDRGVTDRRRQLPLSLTDGSTIYCADLMVNQTLLPAGYLTESMLPCIAEPGDSGALEVVPAWLLNHRPDHGVLSDTGVA